jgi:hypothetical protein
MKTALGAEASNELLHLASQVSQIIARLLGMVCR